ncbi:unnamed protein product [Adineta steineri]|uniref:Uncharacterized protein n=1 Tax=Adineta steineri TaxID=433720 RepID=A0A815IUC5_9BILA|nr:unnamed protein product [Adineta steineri]CAF1603946.1 unnamed protein product [Adineta steineri]
MKAFRSFEEAENGEPIVLIPVSCFITYSDEFEEKKIEFDQFDSNDNQNYSGRFVNQYFKSYMLNIGNNINLRIINTRGIGDTRGLEQDTKSIEHIFSYITNLSYLKAACFLLKPNTNRPDAPFRAFRPAFETIHNIMRNLTLEGMGHIDYTVEMKAKAMSHLTSLCAAATYDITEIGDV